MLDFVFDAAGAKVVAQTIKVVVDFFISFLLAFQLYWLFQKSRGKWCEIFGDQLSSLQEEDSIKIQKTIYLNFG